MSTFEDESNPAYATESLGTPEGDEAKHAVSYPTSDADAQVGSTSTASSSPRPSGSAVQFKSISVHAPEIRVSNRILKYHAYKITSDPSVVDHVYRRYSEFVWLRESLMEFFPGIFVPALPPKKRFGRMNEDFIADERRPGLERFLNRIRQMPILAESAPFQMFITRATTFEEGQKDVKRLIQSNSAQACLSAFKHYYAQVMASPLAPSNNQDMLALEEFLKGEETRLSDLVDIAEDIVNSSEKLVMQTERLAAGISGVYTLEKGYPALPGPQRCSAVEAFQAWHTEHKELEPYYTNSLLLAFQWELHDVKAMLELVVNREVLRKDYEKAKGKADKWKLPSAKVETDKQREQRETDVRNEEELALMLDAVTKLILHDQHRQSWMTRVTDWSKAVGSFATGQANFNQRAYNTWVSLLSPPQ